MTDGEGAAGARVRRVVPGYVGARVYHSLYLPTDWRVGATFPVIVEYAGNGGYSDLNGDTCSGRPEDCNLGYGMSAGAGFIWICLPYISPDAKSQQRQWWGDLEATVAYCRMAVAQVCRDWGGDERAVVICGFSRGAIACNYIGLHDDEIAGIWRASFCHSHYDGVRRWGYGGDDRARARERLERLRGRPQFVSHEVSVAETRRYLSEACPAGAFTFADLPYRNHTDAWVLRDVPERRALREWLNRALGVLA